MAPRQYEIVVLGATGYTGVYIAEAVAQYLPTDLTWAIAGRSQSKLQNILTDSVKPLNKDRKDPAIEICTLDPKDLDALTKKTKVLINAIGPYHSYSEPVVKACAENGTHYIDCTGEVPWVRKMILTYDETAKKSGAIIIPESGFESAVSDLLVYSVVSEIRSALKTDAKDVVASLHELNSKVISGGTLNTVITIFDSFSLNDIRKSMSQWSLAPTPGKLHDTPSLWTLLTGLRTVPGLGQLTTAVTGTTNAAIVDRSGSLLKYGPEFRFTEMMRPKGALSGAFAHWSLLIGGLLILLPPVRWLLSKVIYQPGQGPARSDEAKDSVEYRAVGETESKDGKKVFAKLTKQGNMYEFTGILLAIGAGVLARGVEKTAAGERKGFCTPAMLGDQFVEGMKKSGMTLEANVM